MATSNLYSPDACFAVRASKTTRHGAKKFKMRHQRDQNYKKLAPVKLACNIGIEFDPLSANHMATQLPRFDWYISLLTLQL